MAEQFRPGSVAELTDLVAWAAGDGAALEIQGVGSKRALGRPVASAHRVALDRLSGIGLYEPEELVMSATCGTPLSQIEARLADSQQQLAFEPADYGPLLGEAEGRGTIGAVFACNLSGPRRIKAGAARDHLLGVQAVTGRGDLIKSGGRVVKNVTGYDLCKLLTGSFGTLALMTEVTFKVLPAPPESCTLVLEGLARRAGEQQRAALGRCGQHLEGHLGHQRERAEAAGEQLAEVVAGDVLDHAAAGLDQVAAAGHRLHAEQVVARGAGLDAARAGEVAGERTADRAAAGRAAEQRAVVGGLEVEPLVVRGEARLDLGERCAAGGRHHQLLGLVQPDAGEALEGDRMRSGDRAAEGALGARAQDLERAFLARRPADEVLELGRRARSEMLCHAQCCSARRACRQAAGSCAFGQ
jgi:FAD/FMN-containing dehydrogenase